VKVVVGGSMTFAKEQIEAKKSLESRGYDVLITDDIEEFLGDLSVKTKMGFEDEVELCRKYDVIRTFFNKIAEADAMLVINGKKKGIEGYLGTSVLMEIGLAYYLNKKIYLVNPVDRCQSYAPEVAAMDPIIIGSDFGLVR